MGIRVERNISKAHNTNPDHPKAMPFKAKHSKANPNAHHSVRIETNGGLSQHFKEQNRHLSYRIA